MLRACLLSAAVCMDVFFAAMGCSMNGIHIPKRCSLLISIVGTVFLAASLMGAELLNHLLPEGVLRYGGTALLIGMGSITLMKEGMKTFFRTHPHIRRKAMGLVIDICFDETLADADNSKTLSMKEALTFSAAMSLDSLASGLGAGLMPEGIPLCLVLTLLLGYVLTVAGCHVGKRCSGRRGTWLGGIMLILLGILRWHVS